MDIEPTIPSSSAPARLARGLVVALSLWVGTSASGCGDDAMSPGDASTRHDAGTPRQDAGASGPVTDGGAPDAVTDARDNDVVPDDGPPPPRHALRVLLVGYNPVEGGRTLADVYFGASYGGRTADQIEDFIASEQVRAVDAFSQGAIHYEVARKVHVTSWPRYRDGSTYTIATFAPCMMGDPGGICERRKMLFQYENWIRDNRICEQAAEVNADEIWVVSSPYIMTWENFMVGPTQGYDVNGPPYVVPACTRQYVVHNPSYERPEAFLHIYGHRVEATLRYLTAGWTAADRDRHVERFVALGLYAHMRPAGAYCGNAHFAPNSMADYDYGNHTAVTDNCPDWANFPDYTGATEHVACDAWGCSDNGWNQHWLAAVPHGTGTVMMTSAAGHPFAFPRDFWELLLDPQRVIDLAGSL